MAARFFGSVGARAPCAIRCFVVMPLLVASSDADIEAIFACGCVTRRVVLGLALTAETEVVLIFGGILDDSVISGEEGSENSEVRDC